MKPHNELSLYFQTKIEQGAVAYRERFKSMTVKQIKDWCINEGDWYGFYFPFRDYNKAGMIEALSRYCAWLDLYETDELFKLIEAHTDKLVLAEAESLTKQFSYASLIKLRQSIDLAIGRTECDSSNYYTAKLSFMLEAAKDASNPLEALEMGGVNSHEIMELGLAVVDKKAT